MFLLLQPQFLQIASFGQPKTFVLQSALLELKELGDTTLAVTDVNRVSDGGGRDATVHRPINLSEAGLKEGILFTSFLTHDVG